MSLSLKDVVIKHEFNVCPVPAPRMTRSDKWKLDPFHKDPRKRQRPCVTQYFRFRDEIRKACREVGFELTACLNVIFIVPMPASWSGKKRERMNNTPHQSRPDRDNYLKAFQDSFDGDDGFVYDGRTTKFWGYEGKILVY